MDIRKILVSQPKPASDKSPYFDIAAKYGVELHFLPLIRVEGLSAKEFRQQKISLPDFSAVIFTSRGAVDHFFRLCEEMRYQVPDTFKYFCSSESIALYLQKYTLYRKRKIFHGPTGKFEDLIPILQKHHKENYIFAVSDVSKDNLAGLEKSKLRYTRAIMYRTVANEISKEEIDGDDMIIFFSPEGIKALLKNFPDFVQGDKRIGCFGAVTAQAIRDAGLRLDMEAPTVKAPSITAALDQYLEEVNGLPEANAE
ncbi:MAG: uroporphyrinogen-III synthase [Muribaculaceae bacterium]|nr:uroporphyrinogen-III synthase [Muribaculaceae bacterium]MDE6118477.1 uroporphyrinogen-III synthase [Muribaculaceae bacterium]MDE6315486.1 uroporphyrinogen-III synthase [Muribaculaceae bacterium]